MFAAGEVLRLLTIAVLLLGDAAATKRPACDGAPEMHPSRHGRGLLTYVPHGFSSMPSRAALALASDPYKGLPILSKNAYGSWDFLGFSNVAASAAAILPGTTHVILVEFVQGEFHPNGKYSYTDNLAVYDVYRRRHVNVPGIFDNIACGAYVTLANNKFVAYGGHTGAGGHACGLQEINTLGYRPDGNYSLFNVGKMYEPRWYPTALVLPDNNLFVFSGTYTTLPTLARCVPQPNGEIYSPTTLRGVKTPMPAVLAKDDCGCYPSMFLLPSGDVLVLGFKVFVIMQIVTGKVLATLPPLPIPYLAFTYPYTAPAILLPTPTRVPGQPTVLTLMVFGGQFYNPEPRKDTPGSNKALRITITLTTRALQAAWPRDWTYRVGQWGVEDMPGTRVMADAVPLPDGKVLIINGGAVGYADQLSVIGRPVTKPWLYDPFAPRGRRFTVLAASTIPRMYHSVAMLEPSGRVFVAGCTNCNSTRMPKVQGQLVSYSPYGLLEFRLESFGPPQLYRPRPRITAYPRRITFDTWYTITFKSNEPITRIVLYRPGTVTHSVQMGRHVYNLQVFKHPLKPANVLYFKSPKNGAWVPRGSSLLFLVTKSSYSSGVWLNLQ